jgi:hypothetical protein
LRVLPVAGLATTTLRLPRRSTFAGTPLGVEIETATFPRAAALVEAGAAKSAQTTMAIHASRRIRGRGALPLSALPGPGASGRGLIVARPTELGARRRVAAVSGGCTNADATPCPVAATRWKVGTSSARRAARDLRAAAAGEIDRVGFALSLAR